MRLHSCLPADRLAEGWIWNEDEPWVRYPALGRADSATAAAHGNPHKSPVRPYGDHPAGRYLITAAEPVPAELMDTYGPYKLRLKPVDGEALQAATNGRTDLEIHGGRLNADGSLRATNGCLRVHDATITEFYAAVQRALDQGAVEYICDVS